MASFGWVRATPALIARVVEVARPEDVDELFAASLMTPAQVAELGRERGEAWVGVVEGEPVCVFGVVRPSLLSTDGWPWMVGTDRLPFRGRAFLEGSREVVAEMRCRFPVLRNFVDARNSRAIRWLKWLGFTIMEAEPHGPLGLPFHPFEMRS